MIIKSLSEPCVVLECPLDIWLLEKQNAIFCRNFASLRNQHLIYKRETLVMESKGDLWCNIH